LGGMLGMDKQAARVVWTALMLAALLAVLWLLRDLWFLLIVALLFSYLLSPVVGFVERVLPPEWKKHRFATEMPLLVVYLLMLGAVGSVLAWIGGQVISQAAGLTEKLPELVRNREALLSWPLPAWLEPMRASALEWAQGFLEGGFKELLPFLKTVSGQLLSGLGSASLALLVPVFSFYFLKDGQELAQGVIHRFPRAARPMVGEIFGDLHRLLALYTRALILLSVATFVSYELFFLATGVPYSTLLSALAAVLEFIPVVGPLTAGAVAVMVAGFSGYPHVLWLVAFLLGYRVFQDYVLQPLLLSHGIELHPLLVLVGVLAGEKLAGIPGMFLAIPAVAALRIVYLKLEARRES
jgi:predicted PurR-regulated permease PerM